MFSNPYIQVAKYAFFAAGGAGLALASIKGIQRVADRVLDQGFISLTNRLNGSDTTVVPTAETTTQDNSSITQ